MICRTSIPFLTDATSAHNPENMASHLMPDWVNELLRVSISDSSSVRAGAVCGCLLGDVIFDVTCGFRFCASRYIKTCEMGWNGIGLNRIEQDSYCWISVHDEQSHIAGTTVPEYPAGW